MLLKIDCYWGICVGRKIACIIASPVSPPYPLVWDSDCIVSMGDRGHVRNLYVPAYFGMDFCIIHYVTTD